jgi:Holliday junction resolvase RusA-like endonuclease
MATTEASFRTDKRGEVFELYLPLNPVPASRAKSGMYGMYYGKRYSNWKTTAEHMIKVLADRPPEPGPFHVHVHSVVLRPRTGKLDHPVGDVDNYVKAPLDAITKGQLLWHDDKQVVTLLATKRYAIAGEAPHTYVKAATSLLGLWLGFGVELIAQAGGEDVYDLPAAMRVPFDWYGKVST